MKCPHCNHEGKVATGFRSATKFTFRKMNLGECNFTFPGEGQYVVLWCPKCTVFFAPWNEIQDSDYAPEV